MRRQARLPSVPHLRLDRSAFHILDAIEYSRPVSISNGGGLPTIDTWHIRCFLLSILWRRVPRHRLPPFLRPAATGGFHHIHSGAVGFGGQSQPDASADLSMPVVAAGDATSGVSPPVQRCPTLMRPLPTNTSGFACFRWRGNLRSGGDGFSG
jgi:hypothetical protein